MEVKEEDINYVKSTLAGLKKYKHFIKDDLQRQGFENFESGVLYTCRKLGVI